MIYRLLGVIHAVTAVRPRGIPKGVDDERDQGARYDVRPDTRPEQEGRRDSTNSSDAGNYAKES